MTIKLNNGQRMTNFEDDEDPYKALLNALQVAHMFIVDEDC